MTAFQPIATTYPDLIPALVARMRAAMPNTTVAQTTIDWDGTTKYVHVARISGHSDGFIDQVMVQVDACDPRGIDETYALAETAALIVEQSVGATANVARIININRLSWVPEPSGLPRYSSTFQISILAS